MPVIVSGSRLILSRVQLSGECRNTSGEVGGQVFVGFGRIIHVVDDTEYLEMMGCRRLGIHNIKAVTPVNDSGNP